MISKFARRKLFFKRSNLFTPKKKYSGISERIFGYSKIFVPTLIVCSMIGAKNSIECKDNGKKDSTKNN